MNASLNRLVVPVFLSVVIWNGCGGGSTPTPPPPAKPAVTFSASSATAAVGQAITLTWSSTNATSCAASSTPAESDWTGTLATSGNAPVIPAAAGSISYGITCTGSGGSTTGSAAVTASIGALGITNASIPNGTVGVSFAPRTVTCIQGTPGCHCRAFPVFICIRTIPGFSFAASGGVQPYSWTWSAYGTSTQTPPGLGLSGSTITGTPSLSGTYHLLVPVTDSSTPPVSAQAHFDVTISNPPPPTIQTTEIPAGSIHHPYSATFTASSGLAPYTWSETGTLPAGMNPLTTDGILAGTPTVTGSFPITIN